jgi:hypothetical protein
MKPKLIAMYAFVGLAVFSISACVERPENEMVQETERVDPASGIDLTTQTDGTFKGFSNEEKDAATIEVKGVEKTYSLAENAAGDFDVLEAGDAIAFTTKTENGQERIETLWKK